MKKVLLLFGLFLALNASAQTIRYVSLTGTNTNPATATSWATATNDLQGAINASSAGQQVWVAVGTYKPGGDGNTTRTVSFVLKSGVAIYGGLVVGTTSPQRLPANFSTLSGELGNPGSATDNSYHVVRATSALATGTSLNGFIISNGQADGAGADGWGGGLLNVPPAGQSTSLSLRDCEFRNNFCRLGGGGGLVSYATSGGASLVSCYNCTFQSNTAFYNGGAVFIGNSAFANGDYPVNTGSNSAVFEDCTFNSNQAVLSATSGQGGAVYINGRGDTGQPTSFRRCWFRGNQASVEGGAVYCRDASPRFSNCAFISNLARDGGAFNTHNTNANTLAQPLFSNCSFTGNGNTPGAATYGSAFYVGTRTKITVNNSIVYGNGVGNDNTIIVSDAGVSSLSATATLFDNTVIGYVGTGNFTTTTSPFSNSTITLTRPCPPVLNGSSAPLSTSDIIGTTDLLGRARFSGSPAIADLGALEFQGVPTPAGGSITTAGGASGSLTICAGAATPTLTWVRDDVGYSIYDRAWQTRLNGGAWTTIANQYGLDLPLSSTLAAGQTRDYRRLSFDCAMNPYPSNVITFVAASTAISAGSVAAPPVVPYPLEVPLSLSSTVNATAGTSSTLTWQQSLDGGTTWNSLPNTNAQTVGLPNVNPGGGQPKMVQYRRVITNACGAVAISNSVSVEYNRVDGLISGKVVSQDGTPVSGVTITIVRSTTGLPGSPGSMTYTTTTSDGNQGNIGTYSVRVYWGLSNSTNPGPVTSSQFSITASYPGHTFSAPQNRTLDYQRIAATDVNFTDFTTYGISGAVTQTCPDCIINVPTSQTGLVSCPLDSVQMTVRGSGYLRSGQSGLRDGTYGLYALTVDNPGSYSVTAAYRTLTFSPSTTVVAVTGNVYNLNFTAPTLRTLTGRVMAGCREAFGVADLEFTDLLPKAADSTDRPSCFRKRVRTQANGFYSVTLPARKYRVRVVSFTPDYPTLDNGPDVAAFLNALPADSLTRDLSSTTAVTTLNLTYARAPQLVVRGWPGAVATSGGVLAQVLEQAKPVSLSVAVYQGPVNRNCLVAGRPASTSATSSTVLVTTALRSGGVDETIRLPIVGGVASWTLVPGAPNVVFPYTRTLNVQYTDAYGRTAPQSLSTVVVTGLKSNSATFATVSPQVPLLVLHDPPGDRSFSFWQQSNSQSQALRLFAGRTTTTDTWVKLRLGTKFESGIGVTVETEIWGELGGNVTASTQRRSETESILTTTTNSLVNTSSSADQIGDDADVFVGAALNLYYAIADVISITPTGGSSNTVVASRSLVMAPKGTQTQFYYTTREIRDVQIPRLQTIADIQPTTPEGRQALRQISVWQQVLQRNQDNKNQAPFVGNISIGTTEVTSYTTLSVSKSNTIEFAADIDQGIAGELGFDVGGTGASEGISVNFKVETGNSETNTETQDITTGYTLKDNNAGDLFSIDLKTDPAYGTPVFKVVAAETSCPNEDGTIARDAAQFNAPVAVQTNVPLTGTAQFTLLVGNTSQVTTDPSRTFIVSFDAASNPNSADVRINNSILPVPITVNRLQQQYVTVTVQRPANATGYAFDGLRFQLTDACSEGSQAIAPPVLLSAYFQGPCPAATLVTPEPGWVGTLADANAQSVLINGYSLAGLNAVTLQYRPVNGGSWSDGFTLTASQLSNSPNGTQATWNSTGLPDGAYSLRLKTNCATGNGGQVDVFSPRADGLLDRTPPRRFGTPQPANDVYVPGSPIGITYDEPLACSRLTDGSALVQRVADGQVVPVSVGCSGNQVVLVPASSLAAFAGDVLSVTLTNVADVYGNLRPTPDSWRFRVGAPVSATGNNALTLAVNNSPISESATGAMPVVFRLPQPAANRLFVNFGLSGTARYGVDYTASVVTTTAQPPSTTVTAAGGVLMIPAGATSATLNIAPINDTVYEPNETVFVTLLNGGDYGVGSPASVTAVILNDDAPPTGNVITSLKTGNWEDPDTWDLQRTPIPTDEVVLNQTHTVTLSTTGSAKKVTTRQSARLRLLQNAARLRLGF